jgi:hypothetical protein
MGQGVPDVEQTKLLSVGTDESTDPISSDIPVDTGTLALLAAVPILRPAGCYLDHSPFRIGNPKNLLVPVVTLTMSIWAAKKLSLMRHFFGHPCRN